MSWEAVATFTGAFVALLGFNLGAVRWLLIRYETSLGGRIEELKRDGSEFSHSVEREFLHSKAQLPLDYVRREDWIRFANTLEAKLDAMRAEMRVEISDLRERMYEHRRSAAQETMV